MILRFPADDEINEYFEIGCGVAGRVPPNEVVDLDMFNLYVFAGHHHVELGFTACNSLLSICLKRSCSIHRQFRDLLRRASGVAGLIDVESDDYDYLLLSDPTRVVRLDRQAFLNDQIDPDAGGTDYDVDGFTAALLIKLKHMAEGNHGDQGIATTDNV